MRKFKKYLKKYGPRLGLLVACAAIVLGITQGRAEGEAIAVKDAAASMTQPIKQASTGIVGWLEGIYGYMFRYDRLLEENEALKVELSETKELLRSAQEAERENERYRELLDLRDKHKDFVFESAKVIDRSTSNWNRTFTISKGEESGLEVGDCVVDSSYNLIGQVIELGTGWSTVRSIVDADMRVGVLVGEGGAAAMVVGDFALMQKDMIKLGYLTGEAQVLKDDVLLTSGKGGFFPVGLVVGTVESVHTEAGGQVEYAVISPASEPGAVTQVFVVKDFNIVE